MAPQNQDMLILSDVSNILAKKLNGHSMDMAVVVGSSHYGTNTDDSYLDIMGIIDSMDKTLVADGIAGGYNIHAYSKYLFQQHLISWDPLTAEAFFSNLDDCQSIGIVMPENTTQTLTDLRRAFKHVSSNAWITSRAKWDRGEHVPALKNIFHALRLADLGIQYAKFIKGDINTIDYTKMNWVYFMLMYKVKLDFVLTDFQIELKPLFDRLHSDIGKETGLSEQF